LSGGHIVFYVDGVQQASTAVSEPPAAGSGVFHMGALTPSASGYYRTFKGLVDDVQLYNAAGLQAIDPALMRSPLAVAYRPLNREPEIP
jgi:hypothetical protein